ncbi:ABC transporter permease [Cerasicoccus arenae]|uniref:Transport permease protein n=1 Tax=Cerasicoccus arenae TaxID=424488 RepID=A0A8J3GFL6_9BACT|nr:ABC transporter permease [Cerasicoccus arenae]MBK1858093.1 ABC transporter permease [Cerasicoccus arenae]GHC07040.1 transport permease protein [Cerasicoccus arenae]
MPEIETSDPDIDYSQRPLPERYKGHRVDVDAAKYQMVPWAEIWRFRELFGFLAWRDFIVRYKQTAVGIGWSLLQPLLMMIVMTIVFGYFAGLAEGSTVPYAVMVFSGVIVWQFFSQGLTNVAMSMTNNNAIVAKIYFPRLILPASSLLVNLVDFAISMLLLVVLMIGYDVAFTWRLFCLVPLLLLAATLSFGVGTLVAALNVRYRDFKHILPFVVQIGLYITPVGFSSDKVPDAWRFVYSLNPMVGVVDGFRWAILDSATLYWPGLWISIILTLGICYIGIRFFRSSESWFADII